MGVGVGVGLGLGIGEGVGGGGSGLGVGVWECMGSLRVWVVGVSEADLMLMESCTEEKGKWGGHGNVVPQRRRE